MANGWLSDHSMTWVSVGINVQRFEIERKKKMVTPRRRERDRWPWRAGNSGPPQSPHLPKLFPYSLLHPHLQTHPHRQEGWKWMLRFLDTHIYAVGTNKHGGRKIRVKMAPQSPHFQAIFSLPPSPTSSGTHTPSGGMENRHLGTRTHESTHTKDHRGEKRRAKWHPSHLTSSHFLPPSFTHIFRRTYTVRKDGKWMLRWLDKHKHRQNYSGRKREGVKIAMYRSTQKQPRSNAPLISLTLNSSRCVRTGKTHLTDTVK